MKISWSYIFTIRACRATFIFLVNGVRTLRWCAVGDCAHRLTADAALTVLTGGGFKRPHGVIGALIVTSRGWRRGQLQRKQVALCVTQQERENGESYHSDLREIWVKDCSLSSGGVVLWYYRYLVMVTFFYQYTWWVWMFRERSS